jgi:hypothetical protein
MGPRHVLPVSLWRCYGVHLAAPELTQTIYAQTGSLSSPSIRQLATSAAALQDVQHTVLSLLQVGPALPISHTCCQQGCCCWQVLIVNAGRCADPTAYVPVF